MTINLTVPAMTQSRGEWAATISDIWSTAAEAFIGVGRELIDAKASLAHGEFEAMVEDDLPFGPRTARRLMAIAGDRRISDRTPMSDLPASWGTLYALTRLDDDTLNGAFEAGKIRTDMLVPDVKRLHVVTAAGDGAGTLPFDATACAIEALDAMAASGTARYGAILVDPAWTFETYSEKGKGRSAERHYECMTDDEIAKLPIKEIAADDCVLFLWSTGPKLEDALWVIQKWGFDFKTMGFTWAKQKRGAGARAADWWRGMGYWTRANPEFCILATRGSPKRLPDATDVDELIVAPVREHSRKPDDVRKRIGRLVAGPYIELFSRERAEGWDAWGAEVGKFDDAPAETPAKAPAKAKAKAPAAKKKPAKASGRRGFIRAPRRTKAAPAPGAKKKTAKAPVVKVTHVRVPKPSPDLARIRARQAGAGGGKGKAP